MDKNTQKLLIIGHVWPQPKASAAGEHMLHLIKLFTDLEYTIHFATAAQQPENYNDLDGVAITTTYVEINNDNFNDYIQELNPDVVLFDRFMVEEQFSWRVKKYCPQAFRILDTEDIHFLRKQRKDILKGEETDNLSDIAKRELASIYRSDLSLIISEAEIKLLTETYGIPKAILFYLPLLSEAINLASMPNYETRKDVVFVGNFLHEPNWQAVQTLKKEIWPLVRKQNKDIQLHIYGAYAMDKHKQLQNTKEHFYVHGYVEDLDSVLENSRLLIAPLYFGAGQKGKLLKAMQCGTPSVTTTIGAEAMQFGKAWPGLIEDDYNDFTNVLLNLYNQKDHWEEKQRNILPLVNGHFQYETYLKKLRVVLPTLIEKIDLLRSQNVVGEILWHHSLRSTEFMSRWIMEKNK